MAKIYAFEYVFKILIFGKANVPYFLVFTKIICQILQVLYNALL